MAFAVASHADAWIETDQFAQTGAKIGVASHADAWIETAKWLYGHRRIGRRVPCGRVD